MSAENVPEDYAVEIWAGLGKPAWKLHWIAEKLHAAISQCQRAANAEIAELHTDIERLEETVKELQSKQPVVSSKEKPKTIFQHCQRCDRNWCDGGARCMANCAKCGCLEVGHHGLGRGCEGVGGNCECDGVFMSKNDLPWHAKEAMGIIK